MEVEREGFWVFWHLTSQVTNLEKQDKQLHKEDHQIPGWITPTSPAHVYILQNTLPHRSLPSLCISLSLVIVLLLQQASFRWAGTVPWRRNHFCHRTRKRTGSGKGLSLWSESCPLSLSTASYRYNLRLSSHSNQEKIWSNNMLFLYCADLRWLLVCAWLRKFINFLQEKIMTVPYGEKKEYFKYSLFLVFCNRLTTSAVSAGALLVTSISSLLIDQFL